MTNQEPNEEEVPIAEVAQDKSLKYMGVILGGIILIMGYLTLFVDDPWSIFRGEKQQLTTTTDQTSLLNKTASMSDEEVRQSLVKFIEAFYYDQSRGYFDPPSYFAPITETFYNYHNLTYPRLKSFYWKRRADMENLKRNWIVSSLEFTRQGERIVATYWASESYFRPSKREQQSADIKYELITNENGKIVSLRELEVRNFEAYPMEIYQDTVDSVGLLPNAVPGAQQPANPGTAEPQPNQTTPLPVNTEDVKVYDPAMIESLPEFKGGEREFFRYLNTNSRLPLRARQNASNGKVEVSFVVEKNGSLKDVKIVNGIGSPFDDEALRLFRLSPSWKPGVLNGKAVRVGFQAHVTFRD